MTIRAIFDGKVFVPQEPTSLEAGRRVVLDIVPEPLISSSRLVPATDARVRRAIADEHAGTNCHFDDLRKLADEAHALSAGTNAPQDLAAQLDHYLYNAPRKSDP